MAAFYKNSVAEFIVESNNSIIGTLTHQSGLAGFASQLHTATLSWDSEITILKKSLSEVANICGLSTAGILLEYPIARRSKRIDIVLIINDLIIIIEFKSGKSHYDIADKEQLLDYCLDIRDFHFESRNKNIIPVLLASEGPTTDGEITLNNSLTRSIILVNKETLTTTLFKIIHLSNPHAVPLDFKKWDISVYAPTPTIIEAAQTLYAGKSVAEISNNQAGKENLTLTTKAVVDAIKRAKDNKEKIICFITGIPGAGKTLAGLNIAHDQAFQTHDQSLATFLSGNGPLIKVLRKALERDAFKRLKANDKSARAKEVERIIAFIENVHRFLDAYFLTADTPNNHIVIFDEAQRAWNAEQSERKFQRKFSEAEMMFNVMDRHNDWAVIVALIGGGQEINTGEAGLPEWGKVLNEKFKHWKVYISPELKIGKGKNGNLTLFNQLPADLIITENASLHLNVDIRSYKGEGLSKWVSAVLENEPTLAKEILNDKLGTYEIALTRDLNTAKSWLRNNCQGTRRMGLVASSGARRLRPLGLEVKLDLEVEEWFLNEKADVRSSYYLETPATEFGIQGLELDWVGVCWDADFRRDNFYWDFKAFKGTKWQKVTDLEKRKYVLNKYRVLLTRAREGMIIFIPKGDAEDPTRNPNFYDPIADYLKACGLKEI